MKRILVVDDNALNLELTCQVLEDDYDVLTAENGEEALAEIEKGKPDLVLMDLSMPVLDGWEATRRIRSNADTEKMPVIALSAHAIPAEIDKAMAAGCNAFVTKPVDEDELLEKIQELLKDT
jgi:CheY-like chemotaxis protein